MAADYEKAGVSLEAGYDVVRRIKKHVASTDRKGVMGNIGSFGGMFDLSALNVREPVLVSGTDGVGTKLKIAFAMDKHDTIGIDAVAMCVNDVLAQGAEPLVFLDYIAQGKTRPEVVEAIVSGVAEGCRQAGCALVGGETAEMPGMYAAGDYDLAGFSVGVVESDAILDGKAVKAGDRLLALSEAEVRGEALVGDSVVYMSISGDARVPLSFAIERDGQIVATTGDVLTYEANAVSGTPDLPTRINFNPADNLPKEGWYTLQGVRLQSRPAKSGVYIYNGRKHIIK